jgi:hypothetical protein
LIAAVWGVVEMCGGEDTLVSSAAPCKDVGVDLVVFMSGELCSSDFVGVGELSFDPSRALLHYCVEA